MGDRPSSAVTARTLVWPDGTSTRPVGAEADDGRGGGGGPGASCLTAGRSVRVAAGRLGAGDGEGRERERASRLRTVRRLRYGMASEEREGRK